MWTIGCVIAPSLPTVASDAKAKACERGEAVAHETQLSARGIARSRRAGLILFFSLLLLVMWAGTRLALVCGTNPPARHLEVVTPYAVSGDEPHFIMVVNSILFDHRLELQDEYFRVRRGGLEAGTHWRVGLPDHHTIVVNRWTGAHATWFNLHRRTPATASRFPTPMLLGLASPSPEIYEVSSHPVAYPAMLAAMIAPFRPAPEEVERDAGVAMVVICWAGCLLVFLIARRAGLNRTTSLMAAALLGLASPWLPFARSYYSEPAIGLALAAGLWAYQEDRPVLAALAIAAAAIIKPPYAVVGAGFVLESLWNQRWRAAALMSLTLALCGAGLMSFNYWLARTLVISGNLVGTEAVADSLRPMYRTMLGSQHGLLLFAPWVVLAPLGLGLRRTHDGSDPSRLTRRMVIPLLLLFVMFAGVPFSPGACYGPRYWVPVLPWLALAAAIGWNIAPAALRSVFAVLAIAGAVFAITGILRYSEMFTSPPWSALFCAS